MKDLTAKILSALIPGRASLALNHRPNQLMGMIAVEAFFQGFQTLC